MIIQCKGNTTNIEMQWNDKSIMIPVPPSLLDTNLKHTFNFSYGPLITRTHKKRSSFICKCLSSFYPALIVFIALFMSWNYSLQSGLDTFHTSWRQVKCLWLKQINYCLSEWVMTDTMSWVHHRAVKIAHMNKKSKTHCNIVSFIEWLSKKIQETIENILSPVYRVYDHVFKVVHYNICKHTPAPHKNHNNRCTDILGVKHAG